MTEVVIPVGIILALFLTAFVKVLYFRVVNRLLVKRRAQEELELKKKAPKQGTSGPSLSEADRESDKSITKVESRPNLHPCQLTQIFLCEVCSKRTAVRIDYRKIQEKKVPFYVCRKCLGYTDDLYEHIYDPNNC